MKKLLAVALVLVLCLSVVLVACDKKGGGETTDSNNPVAKLDAAVDAVYKLNKDSIPAETTKSFDLSKAVPLEGIYSFPIEWTVNTDKIQIVDKGNGTQVTVKIPERSPEEILYTLTATVKADDGTTKTVTFERKVPQFVVATYDEYIAACKAGDKNKTYNIVGYVVAVNADKDSSSVGSLWIMDKDGHGYYVYAPVVDSAVKASRETINAEFPIGAEVIANGTLTLYNGAYEFNKGCTVTKTGRTAAQDNVTLDYVDRTEAFSKSAKDYTDPSLVPFQATMASLTGIRMGRIDGLNLYFTIGENNREFICYNNVYLMDDKTMEAFKEKWIPGGKANLKGIVNVYSSKYQIYPNSLDCLEIVNETDAEKVAGFKNVLKLEDKYSRAFTLPSSTYVDVKWTVTGAGATIGEDGYTVTLNQLDDKAQEVTFTATITSGKESDTYTKKVTITKKLAPFKNKVEGADIKTFKELKKAAPTKKGEETTEKFYTMGYISKVDNEKYGNVYIVDENGNEFYVYGLYNYDGKVGYSSMAAAEKPQVDDFVVVYGILSFYNSAQMKNACLLQLNEKVLLPTDAELLAKDEAALKIKDTYYTNFELPLAGANGSTITWAPKEATSVISIDLSTGKVTINPVEPKTEIILVATLSKGTAEHVTKEFPITILDKAPQFTVNYTKGENGNITVKAGDKVVEPGDKVDVNTKLTVTVAPAEGFRLASVTIGEGAADTSFAGKTSFELTITADTTFAVAFETIPAGPVVAASFALGDNGAATHSDGTDASTYEETVSGYTLSISAGSNFYTGAIDAQGNSCLKLGTSSKVGTFTITVPTGVKKVVIYVSGYKAKTSKYTVNGGDVKTATKKSNDGEYEAVEITVPEDGKIVFATVSGATRIMINTIEFYA